LTGIKEFEPCVWAALLGPQRRRNRILAG